MDLRTVDQVLPDVVGSGLGAHGQASAGVPIFHAPIPPDASPGFLALAAPENNDSVAFHDQLTLGRLGVASSLFRALRLKHPPTAKHCLRVALGCSVFCSYLRLDEKTREQIEIAALLHDIGKLAVPEQILNKPDRLDADEYQVMERHLRFGVHILESFCEDPIVLDIVLHSGTWYDGTRPMGCGVMGDDLPLGARILAIQNAYDAMTTDVVYRDALSHDRAISELFENTPTQFDPKLVSAYSNLTADSDSQHKGEAVRRWVEMSNQDADGLWSLAAPLSPITTNPQTIFQQRLLQSMHDGVAFVDLSERILVWNRGAEELTGLSMESLHHKRWQPQIIDMRDMEGNAVKPARCPLLACLKQPEEKTLRMTLTNRSQNQRIAINVHIMPAHDATGSSHGVIMILRDVSSEHNLKERVETLHTRATQDALTGVRNRAEFDRCLNELVGSHIESGEPLGLVICDIDHFKSINDTYGHQAGDAALVEFASLVTSHSRGNDLVARYGGEEFVLLCPGCDSDRAVRKADEIRQSLAATPQPALKYTSMTASFGVTELRVGDTPETMLKRADQALYNAKSNGRNRVVAADAPGDGCEKTTASTWFSWVARTPEAKVLSRRLSCKVPANVLSEKLRGFISDSSAEVVSTDQNSVVLSVDERYFLTHRRQADRPVRLTMHITFMPNNETGEGTLLDVKITTRNGRDRRLDEVTDRAAYLLMNFKSYVLAEEVADRANS